MPAITTLLLVALVTVLWVGVIAGVWALVSTQKEYSAEVSRAAPEE